MSGFRSDCVAACETWLNTPYAHQQSSKHIGCDCLGLILGVWHDLYGAPLYQDVPPYSPDWAEKGAGENLLKGLSTHFTPVLKEEARAGDVLVFRLKPQLAAKHCAIFYRGANLKDQQGVIVHAYWGHAVVQSYLHPFWASRIAACFRFPPAPM